MDVPESVQIARREMVSVTKYRDVDEVLRRSNDFIIGDTKEDSNEFLGGSIVTLDGSEHRDRRRLLARAVNVWQPWGPHGGLFDEVFDRNLAAALQAAGPARPIRLDLVPFARRIIWQTVAVMIGIDLDNAPEDIALLQSLSLAFINAATVEFTIGDADAVVRAGREALEAISTRFFEPSYEARLRRTKQDEPAGDLITTMILASEGEPNKALILREAMVFFTASVNNPVNQTPNNLDDLYAWLAAHPEDRARIEDNHFISRAVQETLRLRRTGNPYLIRRAARSTELQSGLKFQAGERVALYVGEANLDTDAFGDDAARFNPHRDTGGLPLFGLSFGAGPHACIGRPLIVYDLGDPLKLGIQARMLRKLMDAGVQPDPHGARIKAAHAADRFASYGVLMADAAPIS